MVVSDATGGVQPGYYGDEREKDGLELTSNKTGCTDECGLQDRRESAHVRVKS